MDPKPSDWVICSDANRWPMVSPVLTYFFASKMFSTEDVKILPADLPMAEEIKQLSTMARDLQIDALIVDFLVYPKNYLKALKQIDVTLISFHELENGGGCTDLAINYNTFRGFDRYVAADTHPYCFGPGYIILRRGVRQFKPVVPAATVNRLLVTMGASDPNGITLDLVGALARLRQNLHCTFHVGPAFKFRAELFQILDRIDGNYHVRENVAELAEIMVKTDLAIASGGNTMYELCYLGIPSLIISQNPHQAEFAGELDRLGAVRSLGFRSGLDENEIGVAIETICSEYPLRQMMSKTASRIIDGKGTQRILSRIDHHLNRQRTHGSSECRL
jgi:UDP-2,4-diacetamido-2,4,6-trideoxy-beta-L-altropyranose hydrolase